MIRRPPSSTRTYTRFPYTTLFRSDRHQQRIEVVLDAVVAKDQRTIARDRLAPWLPAPGRVRVLVEVATGPAVAEPEIDPVLAADVRQRDRGVPVLSPELHEIAHAQRSEEHTSELQSLMRNSYAVFCLKKKIPKQLHTDTPNSP